MNAEDFDRTILRPAINWFVLNAPTIPIKRNAHVMMLAIAGQESNWTERLQKPVAYAKGFYQFEKNGGVKGVLTHASTKAVAKSLCDNYGIAATPEVVWNVFGAPAGDNLATAFCRLLLWTDPHALPTVPNEDGAYAYYIRNWRPGAPDRSRWAKVYPAANAAVPT